MKTTLLIGTKRNAVTLLLQPESDAERLVFHELQSRGVEWEVLVNEPERLQTFTPKPPAPAVIEQVRPGSMVPAPTPAQDALPADTTIADLIRLVLPEMPSVFHYKEIREAIRARYPKFQHLIYDVYNGVTSLRRTKEIQSTQGGFCLGPGPEPGAVMTPAAETVAH